MTSLFRRKVRLEIAVPFLLGLSGAAFMFVNQKASAATETPKTVWGDKQCLSCHHDLSTLKKMQEKKGDPTFCQAAYEQILKEQESSSSGTSTGWKKADASGYGK